MLTRRVFLEAGLGGLLLAGSMGSTACGAYAAGETQSAQNAAAMARARAKAKAAARKKYWSNFTVCIDPGHAESADLTRVRVNPYSTATQIRETGGAMGRRSGAENRINMFIAKQIAMARAGKKLLVADSSKYSANAVITFAQLSDFDEVITDQIEGEENEQ